MLPQKRQSDLSEKNLFASYLLDLQQWAAECGARLRAYDDDQLIYFSRLTPLAQKKILHDVSALRELWLQVRAAGHSLYDNKQMLWRFLASVKWTPPSDLLEQIHDDRALEIFTQEGHQIFRSLRVLELLSFSLEQAMCTPWWMLFTREPQQVSSYLQKYAGQVFDGTLKGTTRLPPLPHICNEVDSSESLSFDLEVLYVAPLFESSRVVGILSISNASLHQKSV